MTRTRCAVAAEPLPRKFMKIMPEGISMQPETKCLYAITPGIEFV